MTEMLFVIEISVTYTIIAIVYSEKVPVPEPAGKNLKDIYISLHIFKNEN